MGRGACANAILPFSLWKGLDNVPTSGADEDSTCELEPSDILESGRGKLGEPGEDSGGDTGEAPFIESTLWTGTWRAVVAPGDELRRKILRNERIDREDRADILEGDSWADGVDPVDSVVGEGAIGEVSRSGRAGDLGDDGAVDTEVAGWLRWDCRSLSLLEITDDDLADDDRDP